MLTWSQGTTVVAYLLTSNRVPGLLSFDLGGSCKEVLLGVWNFPAGHSTQTYQVIFHSHNGSP
jgi:hypothetical protein